MVNAQDVMKLAERSAKAERLVAGRCVFSVDGLTDYGVVRNSDGNSMYQLRIEAGKELCTCPDFEQRQSKVSQPSKHLLVARLAAAPGQADPASRLKGKRSIALLNGDA
jgi:hypothetical protein